MPWYREWTRLHLIDNHSSRISSNLHASTNLKLSVEIVRWCVYSSQHIHVPHCNRLDCYCCRLHWHRCSEAMLYFDLIILWWRIGQVHQSVERINEREKEKKITEKKINKYAIHSNNEANKNICYFYQSTKNTHTNATTTTTTKK